MYQPQHTPVGWVSFELPFRAYMFLSTCKIAARQARSDFDDPSLPKLWSDRCKPVSPSWARTPAGVLNSVPLHDVCSPLLLLGCALAYTVGPRWAWITAARTSFSPSAPRIERFADGPQQNETGEHLLCLPAEKFVTVKAVGPARVYRTGDLAVRRSDGRLECMGRIDNQVKVRGFRVELEAVETAVQMHPQVTAAAARVWAETDGGMRLSLYVVSRDGTPPEMRALRQFLQTSLPEYMVPSDIIALPAIPLTPNGKTDRKALPRPSEPRIADQASSLNGSLDRHTSGAEAEESGTVSEPPQPGIEAAIASVWCDVLNLKELGRHDNFFELGGHSLEAVRCVSLVNRALGSSVRFASFLQAPTIAQLASIVRGGATPKVQLIKQGSPASKRLLWMGVGEWLTLLAKRLTIDVTLYGVAPDMEQLTDHSVAAMAAQMLPDVLKLQGGPFVIGGFCLRGLLALELARRLNEECADVELLILGDVYAPRRASKLTIPQRIIRRAHRESWNLLNALRSPSGQRMQALRRLLVSWREWQDVNVDDPDIPDEVLQALYITGQHYDPVPYPGRVLFLESGEHRVIGRSTSRTWNEFIKNIEVSPYPGIHENLLFEFYLDAFATRIEHAIER